MNRQSTHGHSKKSQPYKPLQSLARRQRSTSEAVAASQCWAATTAQTLAALLTPELRAGEALPDLKLLQELVGRALDRRWNEATEAEACHTAATGSYRTFLEERDAAARTLYRHVVDLRLVLRGVFGRGPANLLLGFSGDTARDPVALLRQANRATSRLRARPEPLVAAAAARVAEAAEVLRTAAARALSTAKKLDGLALDRRRAVAAFNDTFVNLAGWLETTYRAAGRPDQAARVRPSRRCPGRLYAEVKQRESRRTRQGSNEPWSGEEPPAAAGGHGPDHLQRLEERGEVAVRRVVLAVGDVVGAEAAPEGSGGEQVSVASPARRYAEPVEEGAADAVEAQLGTDVPEVGVEDPRQQVEVAQVERGVAGKEEGPQPPQQAGATVRAVKASDRGRLALFSGDPIGDDVELTCTGTPRPAIFFSSSSENCLLSRNAPSPRRPTETSRIGS